MLRESDSCSDGLAVIGPHNLKIPCDDLTGEWGLLYVAHNRRPDRRGGSTMGNGAVGNVPRCPTCGSTSVEKISTASKVGAAALIGVFALGKISKTFKCKNCGYQW